MSLSPELIYTRSKLLPTLVSSRVYRQLEFLAVGRWWLYDETTSAEAVREVDLTRPHENGTMSNLRKIPGGREDVFTDNSIDLKSKRALMKFLKLATDIEAQAAVLDEWGDRPFPEFLDSNFRIPPKLQSALLALTLSPHTPNNTTTSYALPRIHRHLTSIGLFGPGFGSVIPKWGGTAEIAQVACRAGAVGGGVYVLGRDIESIGSENRLDPGPKSITDDDTEPMLKVHLQGGEGVRTRWIAGTYEDLASSKTPKDLGSSSYMTRTASIISSPLSSLFPVAVEGAPPPAGAVVVFPTGSLNDTSFSSATDIPPVYLLVHTHETGECPPGQCKKILLPLHEAHFMMNQNK